MPARKRHKPGGDHPAEPDLTTRRGRKSAQQDAAKVFADRRQVERDEQRERARAHREAAEREDRRRALGQAKDRAAARLKEVRRRDSSGDERARAEADYRAALDAVLRDEQGLPPLPEGEDIDGGEAAPQTASTEEADVDEASGADAAPEVAGGGSGGDDAPPTEVAPSGDASDAG